MGIKPIQSNNEAEVVFNFLVNETIKVKKIDREQAEKRIRKFLDSGRGNGLTPNDEAFQMIVDYYMSTPVI